MKNFKKKLLCMAISCTLVLGNLCLASAATATNNGVAAMTLKFNDAFEEQAITYTRLVCLKHSGNSNGTLLATCDQHSWVNGEQVWPIFRSMDDGKTWSHISDITDKTFGTNRKAQPMMYELPSNVGTLKAGTLLLAGNIVPDDKSSSRLVVYKSTDHGYTWTYMSTVDTGGSFDYDRSPSSKTSTVWEPFLYMDDQGHLVCAFSDERQKANGVLQALALRYTSDGINWSSLKDIVAIGNKNDRPGMVTVSKLPNGKFIAAYEVVNRPSYNQNSSVVYYKFSDDGINWNVSDLGTYLTTSDGLHLGSSPYVKWVNAGGPNGMVIIGSKWAVNSSGDIENGGQNFFVNYNLGEGNWEMLPQPLTWNGEDVKYLDAFSQCIETNENDTELYQSANIVNTSKTGIDLRVGSMPLDAAVYEAENAKLTNVTVRDNNDASNGKEVGYINYNNSSINFNRIVVPSSGTYTIYVRYNNGSGKMSSHNISVNEGRKFSLNYPATYDWNRYQWTQFDCSLNKGLNSIDFTYDGSTYAELDCIEVYKSGVNLSSDFIIKNRNSGKYLETPNMSTTSAQKLDQYGFTNYPCQLWRIEKIRSGNYYTLTNVNSDMLCEIYEASSENGAKAVQYPLSGNYCQNWAIEKTKNGYYHFVNRNSSKYLEVTGHSASDGADIDQCSNTGNASQEWTLVKEGMR
jgi:hypothetical protein